MKIVGELSKVEQNIGSWGVSFNYLSEGLGFEDILSLILTEKNMQEGKEAPTVKKEHKDISPLDSSLLTSFLTYWRLNPLPEVEPDGGSKENPTISADHTLQGFSAIHYASSGNISDKDYAGQLLSSVFIDELTNNLNTSPQSFGGNVEGAQKINNSDTHPKGEHINTNSANELVHTVPKIDRDLPKDLFPKNANRPLHIEKDRIKEENPHSYGMEIPHQRFEYKVESVQEVKSTKPFHTFNETRSLYLKLEEGEFRMRIVRDTISVKMDFREDFRPPTAQEVQSLIESLSKVGFRMEMLSLNGKNLQWEFRQWQEDRRGSKTREVSYTYSKERPEFNLYL